MLDLDFLMRGELIWNKASSGSPSTAWGTWLSAKNPILRYRNFNNFYTSGDGLEGAESLPRGDRERSDRQRGEAKRNPYGKLPERQRRHILRDIHEYILIFSKGIFTRKYLPDRRSTISKKEFLEFTKSVWTFAAELATKVGHPAPFPVELPYRLIQMYTFKGEVVLDPFIGSG